MSSLPPINLIKDIRAKTNASYSVCVKALQNSSNDIEKAILWLRKNALTTVNQSLKNKEAYEGKIFIDSNETCSSIIEMNSETDFTANSEPFVALGQNIAKKILFEKTNNLQKILNSKFDNGYTIQEEILNLSSITREKIILSNIKYLSTKKTSKYLYLHHNKQIGSLIQLDKKVDDKLIKELAIHISANKTIFLDTNNISKEMIKQEKELALEILKKQNKPDNLIETIAIKKVNKKIEEICLLTQKFLFNDKLTVGQILKSNDVKVVDFCCFFIK